MLNWEKQGFGHELTRSVHEHGFNFYAALDGAGKLNNGQAVVSKWFANCRTDRRQVGVLRLVEVVLAVLYSIINLALCMARAVESWLIVSDIFIGLSFSIRHHGGLAV